MILSDIGVFPAHAGMSPPHAETPETPQRFPRSRGDEPADSAGIVTVAMFSPLTRG